MTRILNHGRRYMQLGLNKGSPTAGPMAQNVINNVNGNISNSHNNNLMINNNNGYHHPISHRNGVMTDASSSSSVVRQTDYYEGVSSVEANLNQLLETQRLSTDDPDPLYERAVRSLVKFWIYTYFFYNQKICGHVKTRTREISFIPLINQKTNKTKRIIWFPICAEGLAWYIFFKRIFSPLRILCWLFFSFGMWRPLWFLTLLVSFSLMKKIEIIGEKRETCQEQRRDMSQRNKANRKYNPPLLPNVSGYLRFSKINN